MKRQSAICLIAVGFAASALAQNAQNATLPDFAEVDENEDGKIDMMEAKALTESLDESEISFEFTAADANEDGAVDSAEYAEYKEEMMS